MTRPRVVLLALSLFLATATFAQSIQYEPLAPTTRDAVTLWIGVSWNYRCDPDEVTVDVVDHAITVTVVGNTPQCFNGFPVLGGWSGKRTIGPLAPGVYSVTSKLINGTTPLIAQQQPLVVRDVRGPVTVVTPDLTTSMHTVHIHTDVPIQCVFGEFPCFPPSGRIGNVAANVVVDGSNDIEATVPSLPPGTYDVTIEINNTVYTVVSAVNVIDPNLTAFQQPRTLERVLIPVVFSGPGAFGSQWTTEVAVVNADTVPLDFFRSPFGDAAPLKPGETRTITTAVAGQQPNGLWLHVPRGEAGSLQFSGLIRDLSRQSQTLGTELPIVRESEFFHQPFHLMNVPTDPKYRSALRVYGFGSVSVPMRIFAMGATTPLVQDTLRLTLSNNQTAEASVTISDLVARYPQLAGQGPLRIELRREFDADFGPSDPGIWGFVSVTNNDTQQVTVITTR